MKIVEIFSNEKYQEFPRSSANKSITELWTALPAISTPKLADSESSQTS